VQSILAFYELHFGIPMAGGLICAPNSRLNASMASVLLQHSEAKVILVDVRRRATGRRARSALPHL
jgi:fatty-acyl-CoA synthase